VDTALLTNTMSGACCNLGPAARDTQRRIFQPFPMRVHEAPSTMRQPKRGSIADPGLILVAAIWGINFSVLKVLLRDLEPLALNALRFPLASLALWTLVRRLPGSSRPKLGDIGRVLLLAAIGHLAYQLCFIVGLDWTFAGNASLLLATTPIWTVILSSAVGHERLGTGVLAGIIGALAGMFLVIAGRGDVLDFGSTSLRGDLLMVVAAIFWSIYTVGGRKLILRYGALRITAWTLWVGTPFLVLMAVPSLIRTDFAAISTSGWLGVVYSGVMGIGVAYLLWYRGVQRLGNSRTAAYSNLVPIAALITAWIWLGEVPSGLQIAGAGVILTGLWLAQSPDLRSLRWTSSGNS
jgi:drug/metabolite transporter (DMT)-like permease